MKLEGTQTEAEPVGQAVGPGGFAESKVNCAEDSIKQGGGLLFVGDRTRYWESVTGIVDVEFFAGAKFLPEDDTLALESVAVEIVEAAVPIAVVMLVAVFLLEGFQGQMCKDLELAADGGEVGLRSEGLLDAFLVPAGDDWPPELGLLGFSPIVRDGGLTDLAALCDLALEESEAGEP